MPSGSEDQSAHPIADICIAMRRIMPRISLICPKCRRQCDFKLVSVTDDAVYEIQCPDCGDILVGSRQAKDGTEFFLLETGEPYDPRAVLNETEAGARALRGDLRKESLATAELAWETYLYESDSALPVWKRATDKFVACKDSDREHALGMMPWILRFCELGGDGELRGANLRACRKAAKLIGEPETVDECMLMMELFDLQCRSKALTSDRFSLPYDVKDAYLSLPEQERAKRPDFPVLWPLIMCDRALDYWIAGAVKCDEHELNRIETDLWNEAMLELDKMLASGAPMTPRIFMLVSEHVRHQMMLSDTIAPVLGKLEMLSSESGEYADAFTGLSDLLGALVMVRGEPLMPFAGGGRYRWSKKAVDKIYDAVERLERYPDPAIVGNLLIDAYFLLYEHSGNPDILDNCITLEVAVTDRLLELRMKAFLHASPSMFSDDILESLRRGGGSGKAHSSRRG